MENSNGVSSFKKKMHMKKLFTLPMTAVFAIVLQAQSNDVSVGADLIVYNAKI